MTRCCCSVGITRAGDDKVWVSGAGSGKVWIGKVGDDKVWVRTWYDNIGLCIFSLQYKILFTLYCFI